ncbi:hypothetical protein CHU98_g4045 [Xylaria longipes]|nr:hypothetical protein CHU98_g4045 [Xylaria longipes]
MPPTSPQNQDESEAERAERDEILDRFHASIESSDGRRSLTKTQASEAIEFRIDGIQIVRYPVENKKADLFKTDTEGRSANFYCRESYDTLEYIVSKAPRGSGPEFLNLQDKYGLTPLHYAVKLADRHAVEHLLALNVDTEIKDKEGKRAIDHHTHDTFSNQSLRLLFAFKKLQNARPVIVFLLGPKATRAWVARNVVRWVSE